MLYWLPNVAASSARLYWESFNKRNAEPVRIPVGCSIFPKEVFPRISPLGREALSESGLLEPVGSRWPLRRVRTARIVCEGASSLLSQDASNVDTNEFPPFDFEGAL